MAKTKLGLRNVTSKLDKIYEDWKNFDDSDVDKFVMRIDFEHNPPYMEVRSAKDFEYVKYYKLPFAMAYWAVVHRGWHSLERENARLEGKRELIREFEDILNVEYSSKTPDSIERLTKELERRCKRDDTE